MTENTKTTTILAMFQPSDLRPKRVDWPDLRVERMEVKCPELNKFLHTVIGAPYRWGGRTQWDQARWYAHVNRDELETWVAYRAGTPAGYFELEIHAEGDVQILSFGLLAPFIGQGLGGHLLTCAAERAWEMGATRVWLNTCTHDHPHAIKNYIARGFQIQQVVQSPANPPIKSFWELMTG
jgi:GNAT superfamily N-acetyltransferase